MALDRLQLARQGVYRSYDADIMSNVQSALVERGQRWQDCSAVSQLCAGLSCDVSEIQDLTVDRVFARQVLLFTCSVDLPPPHLYRILPEALVHCS